LAQKELAHDEGGLDGLPEAHVVGDEEPFTRGWRSARSSGSNW
jgi:hypothetical protein